MGKYVGWTAPAIQEKFKAAMGGVLFIDEAYSLVDDRNGSYGDEAINTIVQEMENHRQDIIVIFAGYPDKMEQASAQHDFGNGRFARKVIEKARMAQAERLIGMDFDAVTAEDVATICEEDLEDIDYRPVKKNVIGFAS